MPEELEHNGLGQPIVTRIAAFFVRFIRSCGLQQEVQVHLRQSRRVTLCSVKKS